ncbi:MAG: STAS domain-containing protein [Solirubrobacteraceae bacterium]
MTEEAPEQRDHVRAADVISLGQLTIESDRDGEVHTICLVGELDLATADAVQEELDRVEASDAGAIVVDLSRLEFMDSTGVRLLVYAVARSREDSNRLTLLRGPAAVQRVLELSGVVALLPFAD